MSQIDQITVMWENVFGGKTELLPISCALTGANSTPPDALTCAPIYFIILFFDLSAKITFP